MTSAEHTSLHFKYLEDKICPVCNNTYSPTNSNRIYCSVKCSQSVYKVDISLEDIVYWVTNYSWVRAGKELGISDNGLRKKYKKLSGLDPKLIKTNHSPVV